MMDKEEKEWAAALLHRADVIAKNMEQQSAILSMILAQLQNSQKFNEIESAQPRPTQVVPPRR